MHSLSARASFLSFPDVIYAGSVVKVYYGMVESIAQLEAQFCLLDRCVYAELIHRFVLAI